MSSMYVNYARQSIVQLDVRQHNNIVHNVKMGINGMRSLRSVFKHIKHIAAIKHIVLLVQLSQHNANNVIVIIH